MVIKSVGVLSVGKVMGCLYALLGLIAGGFFSLFALAGAAIGGRDQGVVALLLGVGAIVVLPVLYALIGFVSGIISAALYNVIAAIVGGIEIELGQDSTDHWH